MLPLCFCLVFLALVCFFLVVCSMSTMPRLGRQRRLSTSWSGKYSEKEPRWEVSCREDTFCVKYHFFRVAINCYSIPVLLTVKVLVSSRTPQHVLASKCLCTFMASHCHLHNHLEFLYSISNLKQRTFYCSAHQMFRADTVNVFMEHIQ